MTNKKNVKMYDHIGQWNLLFVIYIIDAQKEEFEIIDVHWSIIKNQFIK